MAVPKRSFHLVRLNKACKADNVWWSHFIDGWNGVSFFPNFRKGVTVMSDASGSWGCGAYVRESMLWFQVQWHAEEGHTNIAVKELVPIVISAALWGKSWARTKVTFVSDNMAVVHALSGHRAPKEAHLAHLFRCLFFLAVHYGFEHSIQHFPCKANVGADTLSRGKQDNFLSLFPQAHPIPVEVPAPIVFLLFKHNLIQCLERDVSRYFAQGLAPTT